MKDPFTWPEDPRIRDLRTQLAAAQTTLTAIRNQCTKARHGDGRISRRVLEQLLEEHTN